MAPPATAVCVMAKAPIPGLVKTRLCPPLTATQAAELAAAFLLDTWAAAATAPGTAVVLAYAGDRGQFPASLADVDSIAQVPGDLGARIAGVADGALQRFSSVVIVGSDLPGLSAAVLAESATLVAEGWDAVFGPSADGGFYLIAVGRPIGQLLADVPWSSPLTLAACRKRLDDAGWRCTEVEPFDDIDDAAALERLRRSIDAGVITAPHSAEALRRCRSR